MNNISIKRLLKDIKELENNPLEKDGIFYKHCEENLFKGYALIICIEMVRFVYQY